jgi:hypothetical protein
MQLLPMSLGPVGPLIPGPFQCMFAAQLLETGFLWTIRLLPQSHPMGTVPGPLITSVGPLLSSNSIFLLLLDAALLLLVPVPTWNSMVTSHPLLAYRLGTGSTIDDTQQQKGESSTRSHGDRWWLSKHNISQHMQILPKAAPGCPHAKGTACCTSRIDQLVPTHTSLADLQHQPIQNATNRKEQSIYTPPLAAPPRPRSRFVRRCWKNQRQALSTQEVTTGRQHRSKGSRRRNPFCVNSTFLRSALRQ